VAATSTSWMVYKDGESGSLNQTTTALRGPGPKLLNRSLCHRVQTSLLKTAGNRRQRDLVWGSRARTSSAGRAGSGALASCCAWKSRRRGHGQKGQKGVERMRIHCVETVSSTTLMCRDNPGIWFPHFLVFAQTPLLSSQRARELVHQPGEVDAVEEGEEEDVEAGALYDDLVVYPQQLDVGGFAVLSPLGLFFDDPGVVVAVVSDDAPAKDVLGILFSVFHGLEGRETYIGDDEAAGTEDTVRGTWTGALEDGLEILGVSGLVGVCARSMMLFMRRRAMRCTDEDEIVWLSRVERRKAGDMSTKLTWLSSHGLTSRVHRPQRPRYCSPPSRRTTPVPAWRNPPRTPTP
jgi:hypothetical protein